MKIWTRALLWCLALAALTALFRLGSGRAIDARTPLTLLTQAGPRPMTMADWLPLAVAAEMPASFDEEALKAQAVAARTFALANTRHDAQGADVCAGSGCCVAYLDEAALRGRWADGCDGYMAKIRSAVSDTDGLYLLYGGSPIQAAFHASSLGTTEDSGNLWSPLPYLVSVDTPEQPEDVPGLVTDVTVTAAELVSALGFTPGRDPAAWLESVQPDSAGRVGTVTICGRTYTGAQVRSALGLRSTAFTVRWEDSAFRFTVSGHGHGVGMSQYGAQACALAGMDWRDILAHYYPGTVLAVYEP